MREINYKECPTKIQQKCHFEATMRRGANRFYFFTHSSDISLTIVTVWMFHPFEQQR